jgi:hypothetical protein
MAKEQVVSFESSEYLVGDLAMFFEGQGEDEDVVKVNRNFTGSDEV